ncbi:hypothetical protein AURDEDRAFT_123618 [Auricularia subglabra TFB-10046 SS5]|nr:hypothetical protein AURDEDRAFT_123618 [Auricularia subglabra TFB-10046 SS5]
MRFTVLTLALSVGAALATDNSTEIGVGDFGCLNNCMAEVSGTSCGGLDNDMAACVCNTTAFRTPMTECAKKNCRPAAGPYFDRNCESGGLYYPGDTTPPEGSAQSTGASIAGVVLVLAALTVLA